MLKLVKLITLALILVAYSTGVCIAKTPESNIPKTSINKHFTNAHKLDHQLLPNVNRTIKYIGHRGASGFAPENTIPSFRLAGKLGFWGSECDVRTTSDGTWIVLHDDTVDRMTNGTGQVSNFSFSKLNKLNVTAGRKINKYPMTKIPRLKDYLITCKKYKVTPVIEMKEANNIQYYDKFLDIINKYGDIKDTVVISFSTTSLKELRHRNSSLALGLLCNDITQERLECVQALGNTFIDSCASSITKEKVDLCHSSNIKVGAWTVDDISKANVLMEDKVDYLTTNRLLPRLPKHAI